MQVSNRYIVVEQLPKEQKEGFEAVEVQNDFIYKGKVVITPEAPIFMGNKQVVPGDVIIFAKYSPDTHEIEGKKFVSVNDILAVI